MRLSLMFLRMRQARQRAERRSHLHARLSAAFEATILEQAAIVQRMQNPATGDTTASTAKSLLFRAHQRCAQLLQQNTSLQVRLTAERVHRKSSPQLRRITRRLLKRLAQELSRQSDWVPNAAQARLVFGRRRIPRRLRAHLVADPDITLFDVSSNA